MKKQRNKQRNKQKAVHRTLMTLSPGKVIEMRSLMPGKQIFNDALHTGFFVAVLYLSSNGSFLEYRCQFHQHFMGKFFRTKVLHTAFLLLQS